jgi:hypothetical protein
MAFLASENTGTRGQHDASSKIFLAAGALKLGAVQSAFNAVAARTAASDDPELANLVRLEQDANEARAAAQERLAFLAIARSDQVDSAAIARLREQSESLRRAADRVRTAQGQ